VSAHAQRGQVLPLVAMVFTVLMGATGLAVDVGYHRYELRLEQSAADSAALAGAAELTYGSAAATAAAKADAASNGFTDGQNGIAVTVDTSYSSSYTASSPAVKVTISKSYPTFFQAVTGTQSVPVAASSVARMSANNTNCLYQLSPSGTPNFNSMHFDGPNCGIVLNGTGNFNAATIDAAAIDIAGSMPNENGTTWVEATPAPSLPAIDPCPQIPGCAYLQQNPPSTTPCASAYTGGSYLLPGCYDSLNLNGANVTLDPGLYVINGPVNCNGATLRGSGVTFYITQNGSLNLNGATSIALTAPTSGDTANMLFYEVPTNTSGPNFNGSTSLGGVVYFPNADVNYNGSLSIYTVLIVGSVNFNGTTQSFPNPPSNGSYVLQSTMAE
jgi:Flp pilus assembly protein TadG